MLLIQLDIWCRQLLARAVALEDSQYLSIFNSFTDLKNKFLPFCQEFLPILWQTVISEGDVKMEDSDDSKKIGK